MSSAGAIVHTTSRRVLPWIGGPSSISWPGRMRKRSTENTTTVSTSTNTGTDAMISTL